MGREPVPLLHHTGEGGPRATVLVLTLDVHELFGNLELSLVEAVIVGDVALRLRHRDHHVLLLLPEHLLGRDGPLKMVLLGRAAGEVASHDISVITEIYIDIDIYTVYNRPTQYRIGSVDIFLKTSQHCRRVVRWRYIQYQIMIPTC